MRGSRWGFHSPMFEYFILEKFYLQTILEGNSSNYMMIDKTICVFYDPFFKYIYIYILIIFLIPIKIPKKFLVHGDWYYIHYIARDINIGLIIVTDIVLTDLV